MFESGEVFSGAWVSGSVDRRVSNFSVSMLFFLFFIVVGVCGAAHRMPTGFGAFFLSFGVLDSEEVSVGVSVSGRRGGGKGALRSYPPCRPSHEADEPFCVEVPVLKPAEVLRREE